VTTNDPRLNFIAAVKLDESFVLNHKTTLLLFGGKLTESNAESSVRAILKSHIETHPLPSDIRIVSPEDFPEWFQATEYDDLFSFEEELLSLSSLVVLALESPGSIAELGGFTVKPESRKKLLVIMEESHWNSRSYIRLGPLSLLENEQVLAYTFESKPNKVRETLDVAYIDDIRSQIENALEKRPEQKKFRKGQIGDTGFLIHEILSLFHALTSGEIAFYLEKFGIKISRKSIHRTLQVLKKLKYINSKRQGRSDYFFATSRKQCFHFTTSNKNVSRTEIKLEVLNFYKNTKEESRRHQIIAELNNDSDGSK
jgi:hypothetical protein